MVGCAVACGVGVAGTAFALSQARAPGTAATWARAARTTTAGGTSVVTGLATFQPAALPDPLNLAPLVVHPRELVIRGGSTSVQGAGTGSGSDNPWSGGVWSPSGSGGGSGSGGTPTPPPPPPPGGTTRAVTTGGGTTGTSTGTTSTGTTSTGPTSTGPTSTGPTSVVTVALPRNTAAPTISGDNVFGALLTAHPGTWTGSPTGYLYTWLRCTSARVCPPHATGQAYRTVQADLGFSFIVVVTATNAGGSRSARSDNSDTVQA